MKPSLSATWAGQNPAPTQSLSHLKPCPQFYFCTLLLQPILCGDGGYAQGYALGGSRGYAPSSRIEDLCLPVERAKEGLQKEKSRDLAIPACQLVVARIIRDSLGAD